MSTQELEVKPDHKVVAEVVRNRTFIGLISVLMNIEEIDDNFRTQLWQKVDDIMDDYHVMEAEARDLTVLLAIDISDFEEMQSNGQT